MKAGRMYFFDPAGVTELDLNDWIIVRTDLGLDAARVQLLSSDSPLLQIDPLLGEVVRKATGSDVLEINKRKRMETDATKQVASMALERRLPVKILGCDWQFDGASITVFYSQADGDARVDLGEFTQSLEAHFGTRIELRRLGARDETKVMTGVGTCGRELCCSSWLDKFSNISIRMAKEQDLPLNQPKLTGVCGRLKCCLIYELETYQEVKGKLPKVGDTFHSPSRDRVNQHVADGALAGWRVALVAQAPRIEAVQRIIDPPLHLVGAHSEPLRRALRGELGITRPDDSLGGDLTHHVILRGAKRVRR